MVIVLGAGESGAGAAYLAQKRRAMMFLCLISVSDSRSSINNSLSGWNIRFEENQHTEEEILKGSWKLVKSPGIPEKAPIVKKLREKGISVISEIESAGQIYFTMPISSVLPVPMERQRPPASRIIS